jgi:hypothetical protein
MLPNQDKRRKKMNAKRLAGLLAVMMLAMLAMGAV